jgi:hypothetical protein
MNCSAKCEQQYMNSCTSATFCNEFLTFNNHVLSLFYFSDSLVTDVESKIDDVLDKCKHEWARGKLEQTKIDLGKQRSVLKTLLSDSGRCNPREIRELVQLWATSIQDLSLQLDPTQLAAPAKNLIKSHYLLSGMLSMVTTIAKDSLARDKSTAPNLFMYTKGVGFRDLSKLQSFHMIMSRFYHLDFTNEDTWTMIACQKGNPIERIDIGIVNHYMYVRASISNNTKVYLVADPLIVGYQELTLDEMKVYSKKFSVH